MTIHQRSNAWQEKANTHHWRQPAAETAWPFSARARWVPVVLFLSCCSIAALGQVSPKAPTTAHTAIPAHSREIRPDARFLQQGLSLLPPNEAQKEYSRFTVSPVSQKEAEGLFALSEAAFYDADAQEIGGLSQEPITALLEMIKVPGEDWSISSLTQRTILADRQKVADFLAEASQRLAYPRPSAMKGVVLKVPSVVTAPDNLSRPSAGPTSSSPETSILSEGFESGSWGRWTISDNSWGAYTWTRTTCDKHSGSYSADAVRGGSSGPSLACSAAYPNYTQNWLKDGQCENFQGASQAWLDYYFSLNCEGTFYDYLGVYFYGDGQYSGFLYSGTFLPWFHFIGNLKQWYHLGDLTTSSCNQLAFLFSSDFYTAPGFGARIDDVSISTGALGTLTCSISATPSSGSAPLAVQFHSTVSGASGAATYYWAFGDGSTGSDQNPSHTYTTTGEFDPFLEVMDGTTRSVALTHISVAASANDACSGARPISTNSFAETFSTAGYTLETGEPRPCGSIGATAWYKFTPSHSGSADISLCGSSFDTVLAVYSGACGSLSNIACNDDSCWQQSTLSGIGMNAGTTYYIQIGGYTGATGTVVLDFSFATVAAGQFTAPASGTTLVPGNNTTISWTYSGSNGGSPATLYLIPPGGSPVAIAKTTMGAGSWGPWWIPGTGGTGYKLRLAQDAGGEAFESESFTIQTPSKDLILLRLFDGEAQQTYTQDQWTFSTLWCGSGLLTPDGSGLLTWDMSFPLCTGLAIGQGADLARRHAGKETLWPQMVFYPASQTTAKEIFFFEHAFYPSWITDQGYPVFTCTRFPKDGVINPEKTAIVFIHGIKGTQGYWDKGEGLPEAMAQKTAPNGKPYEVWEVSYPPDSSITDSGYAVYNALKRIQTLRGPSSGPLNVVTHSMGGLVIRTVLENLTTKGSGGVRIETNLQGLDALIGKVALVMSPMHGSHSINALWKESVGYSPYPCPVFPYVCNWCNVDLWVNLFNNHVDLGAGAAGDLAMGSFLTWKLNWDDGSPSRGIETLAGHAADLLAVYGTNDVALWSGCDEAPNTQGSYNDTVVNGASANMNQTCFGTPTPAFSGVAFVPMEGEHRAPTTADARSANFLGDLASVLDAHFHTATPVPPVTTRLQTQGLPLVKILQDKGGSYRLKAAGGDTCSLVRNQKNPGPDAIYYVWDNDDRIDLGAGSYSLERKAGWFSSWVGTGKQVQVPQASAGLNQVSVATSFAEADTHELILVGRSGLSDLAVRLQVTAPDGKIISSTRNDFTDGSTYLEQDFASDGSVDSIIVLTSPVDGTYTIGWTGVPSASQELSYEILAYLDGKEIKLFPQTPLYQVSSGTLAYTLTLAPPGPVTAFIAAGGQGNGAMELGWQDPSGQSLTYDIRYSESPILTDAGWDEASTIGASPSPTSSSHRIVFTLPKSLQTYHFKMRVLGATGLASSFSGDISAVSGPGGPGLNPDITLPTTPDVMDDGAAVATPGMLHFNWSASDPESGIARYRYAVGTHINGSDIVGWTDAGTSSTVTVTSHAITGGRSYYCTVVATNGAKLDSQPGFSDGVFVQDYCSDDSYEPDNDFQNARTISLGVPQQHNLCKDDDFFLLHVQQGTTYEIKTYGLESLCKTHLVLWDGTTYQQAGEALFDAADASDPFSSRLTWTAALTGPMVFAVLTGDGTYGAYRGYSVVVRVPDALPIIAIVSPTSGTTVSGTFVATATASDDHGVTKVEFLVNGQVKATDTAVPYAFTWDTTSTLDGWCTLMAVATDTVGQQSSATASVYVLNVPPCALTCSATVSATGTAGNAVAFASTATATNCTGFPVFDWNFGDGTAHSTSQSPSHNYVSAGTFNWSLTVTADGQICSSSGTITISAPCSLFCTATVPTRGAAGQPVDFASTATPSNCTGSPTYDWNFGDGTAHSASQNPSHTYTSVGNYSWVLNVTQSGTTPCTKTGTITIVNPPVITLIKKVSPPFKLAVTGSNLQNGIKVYINGVEWQSVMWKKTTKILLTGAIKTAVPKGTPRIFRFVNPDGGESTTTFQY